MKMIAVLDWPENMERCENKQKEHMRIRDTNIRKVRRKIHSGKYNINKRIDIILDRLLEDILK